MPESKYEITQEYITIRFQEQWYCFPFIVLMEESTFMNHLWERNGDAAPVFRQESSLTQRLIYLYFTERCTLQEAYADLSKIILTNIDQWQPALNACKLYNK